MMSKGNILPFGSDLEKPSIQQLIEDFKERLADPNMDNPLFKAADIYYGNYSKLSKDLRNKISLHMLHEIFALMVVPAIEEARNFDRSSNE